MGYDYDSPQMNTEAAIDPDSVPIEQLISQLLELNEGLVTRINQRDQLRDRIQQRKSQILKQLDSINRSQFEFENAKLTEADKKMNSEMELSNGIDNSAKSRF